MVKGRRRPSKQIAAATVAVLVVAAVNCGKEAPSQLSWRPPLPVTIL